MLRLAGAQIPVASNIQLNKIELFKAIDWAKENDVDMIGLSGLITPSLDEMVEVASEMSNQGFKIPLLIGGAISLKSFCAFKVLFLNLYNSILQSVTVVL